MARQHLTKFILNPEDEGMRPDEGKTNFNESMYFNLIDPQQRVGGWFRVGNRPNEKHAEMSICIYLPDGRIGFMHRKPDLGFAKGHYEQHIAGSGHITVDGVRYDVHGFGLRDHSWGPRNWSAIPWYRWLPMNFGRDFAMMVSIVSLPNGFAMPTGMVLRDGQYSDIEAATIEPVWDENHCQKALKISVRTEDDNTYEVEGKVLSLIPLRHRRTGKDGQEFLTRIAEGFTEYRCNGITGYGISEFLDQVDEAGIPLSLRAKA